MLKNGAIRRPDALPYRGYRRIKKVSDGYYLTTQDNPLPDAYKGATPTTNFYIKYLHLFMQLQLN
ncbi:MAG: hypothetical protein Q8K36_05230 [Alphaproteobacteria bacterium]|nr:hypothetical protein [Alphaproteobacteria bacterium]